ncbi:MAG: RNA polymerase sigma factor [Pseudomonadota bacterium]
MKADGASDSDNTSSTRPKLQALSVVGSQVMRERQHTVEQLFNSCFDALVAFLRSRFGVGPPPAEDVAQTAFERLLLADTLRDDANPKAFLWRTATNLAISAYRHNGVEQRNLPQVEVLFSGIEGDHSAPERVVEVREQLDEVYELLMRMPKTRSEAFLLVRVDGLSHAAAAEQLGVARTTVSKHVALAAAEIGETLEDV